MKVLLQWKGECLAVYVDGQYVIAAYNDGKDPMEGADLVALTMNRMIERLGGDLVVEKL